MLAQSCQRIPFPFGPPVLPLFPLQRWERRLHSMDDASDPKLIREGAIDVLPEGWEGSFSSELNSLSRSSALVAGHGRARCCLSALGAAASPTLLPSLSPAKAAQVAAGVALGYQGHVWHHLAPD